MKDFIAIQQKGTTVKLININQIVEVSVQKKSLRLKMSHGEYVTLQMEYDDFLKLINVATTVEEPPTKVSVSFL